MISGDVNGKLIKKLRANSHRYLGKYTAAGVMTLCQLDDADSTKFYDGSAATLDGTQGDVFMQHPTFYTHAEEISEGVWRIGFADYRVDDTWLEWSDQDLIGVYEACATTAYNGTTMNTSNNNTGYLRSISGYGSLASVSQTYFKAKAANRSSNFSLVRWEHQNIMAFLFYALYGNMNSQAICGSGTDSYSKNTGLTNSLGMTDTNSINGNLTSINFWGLENWWGNKYECVDNVTINVDEWTIADQNSGVTRVVTGNTGSLSTWVYPKRMVIGANLDLIPYPSQTDGDDAHGYCDGIYMTGQSGRVVLRSYYCSRSQGGVACAGCNVVSSYANTYYGSRLAFRGEVVKAESVAAFTAAVAIG
ncbi:MAG: hypothetical protein K6F72_00115 [Bacteroidales bacterium]|nr:hypothetical protein [Bacteroidales bacterium]